MKTKRTVKHWKIIAALLSAALLSAAIISATAPAQGDESDAYVTFYTVKTSDSGVGVPDLYCRFKVSDGTVAEPPVPESEPESAFAAFIGWYDAPQGSADAKPFGFSGITTDQNAFAHFRSDFVVSFLDGSGDVFLTKRVPIGGKVSAPSADEMAAFTASAGKVFKEWTAGDDAYDFDTVLTGDLILTPKLNDQTSYYVFFYSDGTPVPFLSVASGVTVSAPEAPTRAGFAFKEWTTDKEGESPFNFASAISANTTLYAQWTGQQVDYTIMLWVAAPSDAEGESDSYEYYAQYGGNTAVAGTDLNGVTDNSSAGTFKDAIDAAIGAAKSAKASDQTDRINYIDADTYSISSSSAFVRGDGSTIVNVYLDREVYTLNFNLDRTGGTMKIGGAEGTTYSSGGEEYSIQASLGQDIADVWPVRPTATFNTVGSYAFQGWLAKNDPVVYSSKQLVLGSAIASTADSDGNITLTGKWINNGKNISVHYMFESLPGEDPDATLNGVSYTQNTDYSQGVLSPATSAYNAKVIEGYTAVYSTARRKNSNGTFSAISGTPPDDQYLFYTRKKYRLIFSGSNRDSASTVGAYNLALQAGLDYGAIPFGTALIGYEPPRPPTKSADGTITYTFEGWYLDASFTKPFDFESNPTMPAADLPLFAKWAASQYKIYVYDHVGADDPITVIGRVNNERVGELSSIDVLEPYYADGDYHVSGHEGQTFSNWSVAVGPGTYMPLSPETPVTGDMNVYATWTADSEHYTLTYDDSSATDNLQYAYGTLAIAKDVTDSDQTFVGWSKASSGTAVDYYPGQTIRMTADITLYPVYRTTTTKVTLIYNANFDASSITASPEPTPDSESHITNDVAAVKSYTQAFDEDAPAGYIFTGWTTNSDGNEPLYKEGGKIQLSANETTLYALYTPIVVEYQTYLEDCDPKEYNAGVNIGGEYTIPSYDTIANADTAWTTPTELTFVGWYDAAYALTPETRLYKAEEKITILKPHTYLIALYVNNSAELTYHSNTDENDTATYTDSEGSDDPLTVKHYSDITQNDDEGDWTAVPEGKVFVGWNTEANGSGKWYQPGDIFRFDIHSSGDLYAQWKDKAHWRVTFYPTAYSSAGSSEVQFIVEDEGSVGGGVSDPTAVDTDTYTFIGWECDTDNETYTTSEALALTITRDTDFTAVWAAQTQPVKAQEIAAVIVKIDGEDFETEYDYTGHHNFWEILEEPLDSLGLTIDTEFPDGEAIPSMIVVDSRFYIACIHKEGDVYQAGVASQTNVMKNSTVEVSFYIIDSYTGATVMANKTLTLRITPKQLDPKAEFPDIYVGDAGPVFDAAYYDGIADGQGFEVDFLIGDDDSSKDSLTFDRSGVDLYTPYKQGGKAGTYGIYARTGYYNVNGKWLGEITDGYVDYGNYAIDGADTITVDGAIYVRVGEFNVKDNPGPSSPSSPSSSPDEEDSDVLPARTVFSPEHIKYLYGYPDGLIKPERDLTRAETAAVFFRLLSDEYRAEEVRENSFADVDYDDWFCAEVSTLVKLGILSGYPDGEFRPNSSITRAELAQIAVRFAAIMGESGEVEFDFSDVAGHWAQFAIEEAAEIGWLTGYPDGTFRPDAPITRAEFAAAVNRMLQRAPETEGDLLPDTMKAWPDNTPDKWYYLDMQEASNTHEYTRKDKQVPNRKYNYETWTLIIDYPLTPPSE
jgi:uncharacterized repeat protein (TIGR02543 family)